MEEEEEEEKKKIKKNLKSPSTIHIKNSNYTNENKSTTTNETNLMNILLINLEGKLIQILIDEEKKVIDLKSIITDKYGYKTCDQRLSCKTKSLMNNDKLSIYNTEK
jgi:hypothetical protein